MGEQGGCQQGVSIAASSLRMAVCNTRKMRLVVWHYRLIDVVRGGALAQDRHAELTERPGQSLARLR